MSDDDKRLDENVYWEKVTAIATVGTLIATTITSLVGIYLGYTAIKLSGEVASAQMRPILQAERVWYGAGGDSGFVIENNGFGPSRIRQSVYVHFDEAGNVAERLILAPTTSADDILGFLKLDAFVNDSRVTVGVPSVGASLGVDKTVPIIQIAEHQQRSQFFKAQNRESFERAIRDLGVCIVYEALDKRRQLFSEKGACEALKITTRRFRLNRS